MAGYLLAHDQHIAIKVVDYVLSVRALGAVKLLGHVLIAITCIVAVYATFDFMSNDRGQVTAGRPGPAGGHLHGRRLRLRIDRPARRRRHPRPGPPGDPDRREGGRVSLALLLGAILLLFLLRVPMAFAILGPCLAYLIVEGFSLGLAVRLVVGGINSWPLLAVPLFILVGIVATRTEIAARLYDAALHAAGPPPRGPRVRQHRRQPRVLVDERRRPRGRRRHRLDRGRPHAEEGLPGGVLGRPQRELRPHQPDHAAEHPGRRLRVGRGGVHRVRCSPRRSCRPS